MASFCYHNLSAAAGHEEEKKVLMRNRLSVSQVTHATASVTHAYNLWKMKTSYEESLTHTCPHTSLLIPPTHHLLHSLSHARWGSPICGTESQMVVNQIRESGNTDRLRMETGRRGRAGGTKKKKDGRRRRRQGGIMSEGRWSTEGV